MKKHNDTDIITNLVLGIIVMSCLTIGIVEYSYAMSFQTKLHKAVARKEHLTQVYKSLNKFLK